MMWCYDIDPAEIDELCSLLGFALRCDNSPTIDTGTRIITGPADPLARINEALRQATTINIHWRP